MRDISKRDIQVGDFLVYTDGGVTAPDLVFGWVRRLNDNTSKIWVEQTTFDRQIKMKQQWDATLRKWTDSDRAVGVSIVNHTQRNRFMILD